jgi:plasmid stability protein
MATLLVRNLDDDLVRRLKERARTHGRSVEAEHRAILQEALAPTSSTQDLIDALQKCRWIGELDADELRDREPPREFAFDPKRGTTVR